MGVYDLVYNDKNVNRSDTPALHCGVWHQYSGEPKVTSETQQPDPQARECLERLLSLIKKHVAPIITMLLRIHSPNLWEKHMRAYQYIRQTVKDPFGQFDCIDFGGAFFTVAMKEGSSEKLHVDFHDHAHSLTWLVPFGEWTGGDFVAPQIRESVPVGPGQVLGAMTRRLAHRGTQITSGRRLVLTCFTDNTLICHSQRFVQN